MGGGDDDGLAVELPVETGGALEDAVRDAHLVRGTAHDRTRGGGHGLDGAASVLRHRGGLGGHGLVHAVDDRAGSGGQSGEEVDDRAERTLGDEAGLVEEAEAAERSRSAGPAARRRLGVEPLAGGGARAGGGRLESVDGGRPLGLPAALAAERRGVPPGVGRLDHVDLGEIAEPGVEVAQLGRLAATSGDDDGVAGGVDAYGGDELLQVLGHALDDLAHLSFARIELCCGERHVLHGEPGLCGLGPETVTCRTGDDADQAGALVVQPHAAERVAELLLPVGPGLGEALADAGLGQELLRGETQVAPQRLDERGQLRCEGVGQDGERLCRGWLCGSGSGCGGRGGGFRAGGRRGDHQRRGCGDGGECRGDAHDGLP